MNQEEKPATEVGIPENQVPLLLVCMGCEEASLRERLAPFVNWAADVLWEASKAEGHATIEKALGAPLASFVWGPRPVPVPPKGER